MLTSQFSNLSLNASFSGILWYTTGTSWILMVSPTYDKSCWIESLCQADIRPMQETLCENINGAQLKGRRRSRPTFLRAFAFMRKMMATTLKPVVAGSNNSKLLMWCLKPGDWRRLGDLISIWSIEPQLFLVLAPKEYLGFLESHEAIGPTPNESCNSPWCRTCTQEIIGNCNLKQTFEKTSKKQDH